MICFNNENHTSHSTPVGNIICKGFHKSVPYKLRSNTCLNLKPSFIPSHGTPPPLFLSNTFLSLILSRFYHENNELPLPNSIMPIEIPDDINSTIALLPDDQHSFEAKCSLERRLQAVLFRFNVSEASVTILMEEDLLSIERIRMATNPDGNAEQPTLFDVPVAARVDNAF